MLNALILANGEAVSRHRLEAYIENLINMLDALDGDPDLEEGGDLEPYLAGADPGDDDREHDDEREHDPAECGIADLDGLAEQFSCVGYISGVQ
jgi:hypothetical protein